MSRVLNPHILAVAKSRRFTIPTQLILICLLLCSTTINIFQARKMGDLRHVINQLKLEGKLREGDAVPQIEAHDLTGQPVTLRYELGGPATVLYVFSPACVWCTKNLENIKAIAKQTRGAYRLIGLSLSTDKLKEYAVNQKLDFPVYSDLPQSVISAYKLTGTPETIIVSPEGRVVKRWTGAYTGSLQGEVERFFNLPLPGVVDPSEAGEKGCDDCDETASKS